MKKIFSFVLVAVLVLSLTGCPDPDDGKTIDLPTLTIRNESSFVLSNVTFAGHSFATQGEDLPVSAQASKQMTAADLNSSGYLTLTRKDIGIIVRMAEIVSITDENVTITIIDNTVVEQQGNTSNRKMLKEISFITNLSVEFEGLTVAANQTINLGETIANSNSTHIFTIKNGSGGRLIFTGTEPVSITEDDDAVFAISQQQQPAKSIIEPNENINFTVSFSPRSIKSGFLATVTIESNNQSGPFVFRIRGDGVAVKPIVNIVYNNSEIVQDGTIDAGNVMLGYPIEFDVIVRNTGTAPLTVTVADIGFQGDNAGNFSIANTPVSNVPVGQSITVKIKADFDSSESLGEKGTTLRIPTNDETRPEARAYLRVNAINPIFYWVNYHHEGLDSNPGPEYVLHGGKVPYPEADPFRFTYTFVAWYDNPDFTGEPWNYDTDIVTGPLTLYSKWNPPAGTIFSTYLEDNFEFADNFQSYVNRNNIGNSTSLNNVRFLSGERYDFDIAFTATREIEDLTVLIADTSSEVGGWKVISLNQRGYEYIALNLDDETLTPISKYPDVIQYNFSLWIDADSSSANADANTIIFQAKCPRDNGPVTLHFSRFNVSKVNSAEVNNQNLGDFSIIDPDNPTRGWRFSNNSTVDISAARFLVLETRATGSQPDAFNDIIIFLSSNGTDNDWIQSNTVEDSYLNYPRAGEKLYVVINLEALNRYSDFASNTNLGWTLAISYYPIFNNLGIQRAFLTDKFLWESVGENSPFVENRGFITKYLNIF